MENHFFPSASAGRDFGGGFRHLLMHVADVTLNPLGKIIRSDLKLGHTATKTIARRGDCGASRYLLKSAIKSNLFP